MSIRVMQSGAQAEFSIIADAETALPRPAVEQVVAGGVLVIQLDQLGAAFLQARQSVLHRPARWPRSPQGPGVRA